MFVLMKLMGVGSGRKTATGADDRKDRDDGSRDGWRYERRDGKEKSPVMEESSRSDEDKIDEDSKETIDDCKLNNWFRERKRL